MRFGQLLEENLAAEWWEQYIAYNDLKAKIEAYAKQNHHKDGDVKESFQNDFLESADREFEKVEKFYAKMMVYNEEMFEACKTSWDKLKTVHKKVIKRERKQTLLKIARKEKEPKKSKISKICSLFKCRKKSEAYNDVIEDEPSDRVDTGVYSTINSNTTIYESLGHPEEDDHGGGHGHANFTEEFNKLKVRDKATLKQFGRVTQEFYWRLSLLDHYKQLNSVGFRKIIKKFDKNLNSDVKRADLNASTDLIGYQKYSEKLVNNKASFFNDERLNALMKGVEDIATELYHNEKTAMNKLRVDKDPFHKKPPSKIWITISSILIGTLIMIVVTYYLMAWLLRSKCQSLNPDFHIYYNQTNPAKYSKNSTKQKVSTNSTKLKDLNSCAFGKNYNYDKWYEFKAYMPGFYISVYLISVALNMFAFEKVGIKYKQIFEINPRVSISAHKTLALALLVCNVVGICFVIESRNMVNGLQDCAGHVAYWMYVSGGIVFIIPLPIFAYKARFWIFKKFLRTLSCGMLPGPVRFTDFFLTDQLIPLALVFVNYAMVMCMLEQKVVKNAKNLKYGNKNCKPIKFYVALFVGVFPSVIRCCQCLRRWRDLQPTIKDKKIFPQFTNFLKYFCFSTKVVIGAFYMRSGYTNTMMIVYFVFGAFATLFKIWWDFKMDWFFFREASPKHKFLRSNLTLKKPTFYYFSIVYNFTVRFLWMAPYIVKLILKNNSFSDDDVNNYVFVTASIAIVLEIIRLGCWNFIRMENEHLHNCGDFRLIVPITAHDYDSVGLQHQNINVLQIHTIHKDKKNGDVV